MTSDIRSYPASRILDGLILSPSGWRGVFAQDEESLDAEVPWERLLFAAAAALAFDAFLGEREGPDAPKGAVVIGTDTRPTRAGITAFLLYVFAARGRQTLYTGAAASPELMAFAGSSRAAPRIAGFVYVSASHNPPGYNGFKFGLATGGVLSAGENARLVELLHTIIKNMDSEQFDAFLQQNYSRQLRRIVRNSVKVKNEALGAYGAFLRQVLAGSGDEKAIDALYADLRQGLKERPLGVCADFNGSARASSIDRAFFAELGIPFTSIHDTPGDFAHGIVPEGANLETCRFLVEETFLEDGKTVLGYVPDCDGDRGNLVIWDDGGRGRARVLGAQEVFALACMSELAFLVWNGTLRYDEKGNSLTRAAIVANGPTSLRIDRIAAAFDVPVFRAEVGEANVTGLAARLRERGCIVRVAGEGSAGGVIIHPQQVRDPLGTIGAILKLFALRRGPGGGDGQGLFEIWCGLSGQRESFRRDFTLADAAASLPAFVTTGAYTPEAKLTVRAADHRALKMRYQEIFMREWEEKKDALGEKFGITGWEASADKGMEELQNLADFGKAERGGLKVNFLNSGKRKIAFIWMRGSATEPVFRIMADAEGTDPRLERCLIGWQREMVLKADESLHA